jgi:hypothetical protein
MMMGMEMTIEIAMAGTRLRMTVFYFEMMMSKRRHVVEVDDEPIYHDDIHANDSHMYGYYCYKVW